jgi:hypothetical protein
MTLGLSTAKYIIDYTKEAMSIDKNDDPVIDTPNGSSADFYGLVTAFDRAGIFDR